LQKCSDNQKVLDNPKILSLSLALVCRRVSGPGLRFQAMCLFHALKTRFGQTQQCWPHLPVALTNRQNMPLVVYLFCFISFYLFSYYLLSAPAEKLMNNIT